MIFNIAKIVKSTELLEEKQAKKLVEQLSQLDWLKLKKVVLSFKGVKLVNLNFLVPFAEFIHNIDMQDLDNEIKITVDCKNDLHVALFKEAYLTVKGGV